jgi:hypothetical protein
MGSTKTAARSLETAKLIRAPIIKPFHCWKGLQVAEGRSAATNVSCLEAFRPLQQVELNRLSSLVSDSRFPDRGEVDENIFAG